MTDKRQNFDLLSFEEMAKDLCKACLRWRKLCVCENPPCTMAYRVSEALYNARYRKVEQDYAELLYEYERVSEGLVDAMELVHKIKAKRDALEQQLAETRKETAREILKTIETYGFRSLCDKKYGNHYKLTDYMIANIKHKYGVDLED